MRKFVVLLAAVLVVAGAWSGGWFYAAGEIGNAVANLGQGDGEVDPKVTCGNLTVTGFPFWFDIECKVATIVSGDATTTVAGLKASVLAYNPTQAKVSALGPITLADAFTGAESRIDFTGAEGSARLEAADIWKGILGEGWRIARVSLIADDVVWTDTLVGETPVINAARVEAHLIDIPEKHDAAAGTSALAAYATLNDTTVPGVAIAGGEATIEAELSGLPDDLRKFGEANALIDWQNNGGQFKLVSLRGTAGEEFVESSGAMGLDSGTRLDGQIVLKSRGLVERLGPLLPPDWQRLIVGAQADDGSYSQTITIKAGVVFTGLMPVTIIPPLVTASGAEG